MSQPTAVETPGPGATRWLGRCWLAVAAIVMLPLAFAFVQTPLHITDVFTGPEGFYSTGGDFTSLREIVPNYLHALFKSTYQVRPTQVLFNNVQYAIFGPELGLMYAIKWSLKFASALLVLAVLKSLGTDDWARYAAASLVLFHPATLEPLLWSADGMAVVLMLATIALSLKFAGPQRAFRIDELRAWQYAALFVLWLLLLGVKEISFVICACLVLVWQATALRSVRAWIRLMPFYALLAFWAWRLSGARGGSDYAASFFETTVRLLQNLRLICPPSPWHLLAWLCLALLALAVVSTLRAGSRWVAWSVLFFIGAATAGLLFISVPRVFPSARYNIPMIYLLALGVGVGLGRLPKMLGVVKPALVLLVPALMAGDLYSQTLAFVEDAHEFNEAIGYLESGAEAGYSIACSGDDWEAEGLFGIEGQYNVKHYFEKYGPRFFGLPCARRVYLLNGNEPPPAPYRLLTTYSPSTLATKQCTAFAVERISAVAQFERKQRGPLAKMTKVYTRLAHFLGNDHFPYYDTGPYFLAEAPRFFLYSVEPTARENAAPPTVAHLRPACRVGAFLR
jgi:hypothetical protein